MLRSLELNQYINGEEIVTYFEEKNPDIFDYRLYSYMLTWLSFMNKLFSPNASDSSKTNENLKQSLKQYIDINKNICENFLNFAFYWIEILNLSLEE